MRLNLAVWGRASCACWCSIVRRSGIVFTRGSGASAEARTASSADPVVRSSFAVFA